MLLIISYGNPLRGDDGAGLLLGKQLEKECRRQGIDVERLECHQLTPELVAELINPEVGSVVFTDTRIASPDSSGLAIDIEQLTPQAGDQASGHYLDPQTLLLLADRLYDRQVPGWRITVPGLAFEHGERLSHITQRALEQAPTRLRSFLEQVPTASE